MNGPEALQPDQIIGWMELNSVELTTAEISLILDIDTDYRQAVSREQERNKPPPPDTRPRPRGAR